jgi:hypothetical protein
MTGDFHVGLAVIDIYEKIMVGQDGSYPVDEIDDVRPGNETDVGQTVMTGCKSISADENAFKMFRGERSGKDVIHPDDRKDVLRYRYLPVSTPRFHGH